MTIGEAAIDIWKGPASSSVFHTCPSNKGYYYVMLSHEYDQGIVECRYCGLQVHKANVRRLSDPHRRPLPVSGVEAAGL